MDPRWILDRYPQNHPKWTQDRSQTWDGSQKDPSQTWDGSQMDPGQIPDKSPQKHPKWTQGRSQTDPEPLFPAFPQLFLDDTKVKNFITCFKGTGDPRKTPHLPAQLSPHHP
uniref:Uncharacterized protein n=1 Tax=Bubo bubo TaxID=30461 RepID=A0A8C0FIM6_BUBBB